MTGLLLLTDDGVFAHRVTAPRSEIRKVYEVWTDGPLGETDAERLTRGVALADGTRYRPAELEIDSADPAHGSVTVTEGKYHEVKNLLAVCGRRVLAMRRTAVGGLRLDEKLTPGEARPLSEGEIASIFL